MDEVFSKKMTHHLKRMRKQSHVDEEWVAYIWNYQSWCFTAPTYPISIFLDTRTLRAYDLVPQPIRIGNIINEGTDAPQLIGKNGWEIVSDKLDKSPWNPGDSLIIISPTPLYGIGMIESTLNRYVYPLRILGLPLDYTADFEAWKYNGTGFNHFIEQIAAWNPESCFILSGDVHYAGAVQSDIQFNHSKKMTIIQYTSSLIHNMSFFGVWGFLMKIAVWFNSLKRKKQTIHQCCVHADNLIIGENQADHIKWSEQIRYLPLNGKSVIETDNNIGLLTLDKNTAANKLLTYKIDAESELQ